jgi:hypothetical protein
VNSSERQVSLLDQIARGQRPNEAPDWPNIIEEIGDLGRNKISAVRSLLTQALVHDLKSIGWPDSRDADSCRAEARGFRGDARDEFVPSMRQRLDASDIFARALDRLPATLDGQPPMRGLFPRLAAADLDALLNGTEHLLADPHG